VGAKKRIRARPSEPESVDERTIELVYVRLTEGWSPTLIACTLNFSVRFVAALRSGDVAQFEPLYNRYKERIPQFSKVHYRPQFLDPLQLHAFLEKHPGAGMPMPRPDLRRYRAENRLRRETERVARSTVNRTGLVIDRNSRSPSPLAVQRTEPYLSEDDLRDMFERRYSAGEEVRSIAARYNLSLGRAYSILNGTYRWARPAYEEYINRF
jgi:hypothetical protein